MRVPSVGRSDLDDQPIDRIEHRPPSNPAAAASARYSPCG
jgi:hypothetical protein